MFGNKNIKAKANIRTYEKADSSDSNAFKSQAEKITDPGNTAEKTETSGLTSESAENAENGKVNTNEESGAKKGKVR